jgi:hypothetical protein
VSSAAAATSAAGPTRARSIPNSTFGHMHAGTAEWWIVQVGAISGKFEGVGEYHANGGRRALRGADDLASNGRRSVIGSVSAPGDGRISAHQHEQYERRSSVMSRYRPDRDRASRRADHLSGKTKKRLDSSSLANATSARNSSHTALRQAGWDEMTQLREEVSFTRLEWASNGSTRAEEGSASRQHSRAKHRARR